MDKREHWRIKWAISHFTRGKGLPTDEEISVAKHLLDQTSAQPSGTVLGTNQIEKKYDLMIIVPAYNVEKYIEDCMDSIVSQKTSYSFVTVIVDDGSTDQTFVKLKKYSQMRHIKIFRQNNLGVSSARNFALRHMLGKYIMFVDGDDILPAGAVDTLLQIALNEDADIVEGGHYLFGHGRQTNVIQHAWREEECPNRDMLFGYPWGKVIRAELFLKFQFPQGYWFEDTIMNTLIFPQAHSVRLTSDIVYGYRQNEDGISKTAENSVKAIDTFWVTQLCWIQYEKEKFEKDNNAYKRFLNQIQLNYIRTSRATRKVKKSIFVLTRALEYRLFSDRVFSLEAKEKYLSHCIRKGQFDVYCTICNQWWHID